MAVESNKVCRCCASFLDLGITTAALLLAEFKGKNASGYENFHLLMPSYSFKITEQLSFVVDTQYKAVKRSEVKVYLFVLNLTDTLVHSLRAGDYGLPVLCLKAKAYDVSEVTTKPNIFSISE